MWGDIFSKLPKDFDKNEPLTEKILNDPDHAVVNLIIYIYTMETFIYTELNDTSRKKNVKKLELYGPFACAISFILESQHSKKEAKSE